jgi:RNA-directed DNA polymerase
MKQSIENIEFMSGKAWQSLRGNFGDLLGNSGAVSELSPVLPDKVVQRLLLNVLEPLGDICFSKSNFGFRHADSLDLALSRVRELVAEGYVWLGIGNIEGCFSQLPFDPVLKKLHKLCGDEELVALVRQILDAQRVDGGGGLFPDMLLAPFLCNLYLHDFDRVLQRKKVVFVRFREDFIVFAVDERAAFKALGLAERQLGKMGLELNPAKTMVVRSASKYKFRGKRLPNIQPLFQNGWASWLNKVPEFKDVVVDKLVAGRFLG